MSRRYCDNNYRKVKIQIQYKSNPVSDQKRLSLNNTKHLDLFCRQSKKELILCGVLQVTQCQSCSISCQLWSDFSGVNVALSCDQIVGSLTYIPIEFSKHFSPIAVYVDVVRPQLLLESLCDTI